MSQPTSPDSQDLKVLESLSALMDNEADDLELRRILKSCERQPELVATWERFHLVQSVLHGKARPVSAALSQRIASAIAADTAPVQSSPVAGWQQTFARIAVAASVAVVFIVAVQSSFTPDATPALVQQASPQPLAPALDAVVVPQTLLAADTSVPVTLDPAAQQRLQEYLERVTFDAEEPVITVHIQDSPLYRLVNELGTKPR